MAEREAHVSISYTLPKLYVKEEIESCLEVVKAENEQEAKDKAIAAFKKRDTLKMMIIKEVEFLRWLS